MVFIQFPLIDVDFDDRLAVLGLEPRNHKAGPGNQDYIGIAKQFTAHADLRIVNTHILRMARWHNALRLLRPHNGSVQHLSDGGNLWPRLCAQCSAANNNGGPSRASKRLCGTSNKVIIRLFNRIKFGLQQFHITSSGKNVRRDLYLDRSRPAGGHLLESLVNSTRDFSYRRYASVPFDNRLENIKLFFNLVQLPLTLTERTTWDLARYQKHGRRRSVCRPDRRRGVQGAGPGHYESHSRLARHSGIPVRHVRRRLLVTCTDQPDGLAVMKGVESRHDLDTREREHRVDALRFKRSSEGFGAGHLRHIEDFLTSSGRQQHCRTGTAKFGGGSSWAGLTILHAIVRLFPGPWWTTA